MIDNHTPLCYTPTKVKRLQNAIERFVKVIDRIKGRLIKIRKVVYDFQWHGRWLLAGPSPNRRCFRDEHQVFWMRRPNHGAPIQPWPIPHFDFEVPRLHAQVQAGARSSPFLNDEQKTLRKESFFVVDYYRPERTSLDPTRDRSGCQTFYKH